jgi:predicted DNA binding CopG/RHH family protein
MKRYARVPVLITVRLPEKVLEVLDQRADAKGMLRSEYVRMILTNHAEA